MCVTDDSRQGLDLWPSLGVLGRHSYCCTSEKPCRKYVPVGTLPSWETKWTQSRRNRHGERLETSTSTWHFSYPNATSSKLPTSRISAGTRCCWEKIDGARQYINGLHRSDPAGTQLATRDTLKLNPKIGCTKRRYIAEICFLLSG